MGMLRSAALVSVGALVVASALGACSSGMNADPGDKQGGTEQTGMLGLALEAARGVTFHSFTYSIVGPNGFTRTGTIDVTNSSQISVVIGGLPVGNGGYQITVTGVSVDGVTSCSGMASFTVTAHATTNVTVVLDCHQQPLTGGVGVNGTLNICPVVQSIGASPGEAAVGASIALSGVGYDADQAPSPLTYAWTTSLGTLSDSSAASPTLLCTTPGIATVTLQVSDGDPSPSCADSQTITVTCTGASPASTVAAAWVEMGAKGKTIARAVTADATCPAITIDGITQAMSLRVAAGTMPLRTTISAPADSKPSAFPVSTCESVIPAGASTAMVGGKALPLPKANPQKILVIGDTGCRLKKAGAQYQACNDPSQFPLAQLSSVAASLHPDVVLHVGDYQYRENECPSDIAGCAGSPWGYGWDTWQADLFQPAAPLLAAAPWIMTRGNHEQCTRAGQGWYRFLDPATYSEEHSCNDPANDASGSYNDPYAVPLGSDTQVIVFDSSNTAGNAITQTSNAAMWNNYQTELLAAGALVSSSLGYNLWSSHHPILGFAPIAGAPPAPGNLAMQSVMNATYPGSYFPPGVNLALHGHTHLFQAIDYTSTNVATLVAGNAGTALDIALPDPFDTSDQPAPGVTVKDLAQAATYGFLMMTRAEGVWTVDAYKLDGSRLTTCSVQRSGKLTCSNYGFLY